MLLLSQEETRDALPFPELIEALAEMLQKGDVLMSEAGERLTVAEKMPRPRCIGHDGHGNPVFEDPEHPESSGSE